MTIGSFWVGLIVVKSSPVKSISGILGRSLTVVELTDSMAIKVSCGQNLKSSAWGFHSIVIVLKDVDRPLGDMISQCRDRVEDMAPFVPP